MSGVDASSRHHFDYAVVRVVPRVERGEFLNVGVIARCVTQRFLDCRLGLDRARLAAFAPALDADEIEAHLQAIARVCRGGKEAGALGEMPQSARWHWLVAPRSTVIQTSPVHSGLCDDLSTLLDELFERLVRTS